MTQTFKTLADVVALAEFAHRNQTDKAGMPYIKHPQRVMENVQAQGAMPYVQMAAVLHDVTEDTAFTPEMLLDLGVPEAAVEIVKLCDRDYSMRQFVAQKFPKAVFEHARQAVSKDEAERFYYLNIRKSPAALQVKLADIGDNLQPWRLSYLPVDKQEYLRNKYAKAIKMLTGEW